VALKKIENEVQRLRKPRVWMGRTDVEGQAVGACSNQKPVHFQEEHRWIFICLKSCLSSPTE
jgi:hypothetical protein